MERNEMQCMTNELWTMTMTLGMTMARIIPVILVHHLHRLRYINRLLDARCPRRISPIGTGKRNEMRLVVAVVDGVLIALGQLGRIFAAHVTHLAEREARRVLVGIGPVGRGAVLLNLRNDQVGAGETGADESDASFSVSGQHDTGEGEVLVPGSAVLDHQHQPIDTERRGQTTSRQDTHHPQFLVARHLQRPGQRQWRDQDNQITDHTDHRVGNQRRLLVQARCPRRARPVRRHGVTHADFDDFGNDVVDAQRPEEDVDQDDLGFVRAEDPNQDVEQSDFNDQGHGAVDDGGDVGPFAK